jgi:hypothetical protein
VSKAKAVEVVEQTLKEVVEPAIRAALSESESPRDKFLRLAPARTEAAIKRIKLLGNLASSAYEFKPTESEQIIEALFDAVHDLKRRFEKTKKKSGFTFKKKEPVS